MVSKEKSWSFDVLGLDPRASSESVKARHDELLFFFNVPSNATPGLQVLSKLSRTALEAAHLLATDKESEQSELSPSANQLHQPPPEQVSDRRSIPSIYDPPAILPINESTSTAAKSTPIDTIRPPSSSQQNTTLIDTASGTADTKSLTTRVGYPRNGDNGSQRKVANIDMMPYLIVFIIGILGLGVYGAYQHNHAEDLLHLKQQEEIKKQNEVRQRQIDDAANKKRIADLEGLLSKTTTDAAKMEKEIQAQFGLTIPPSGILDVIEPTVKDRIERWKSINPGLDSDCILIECYDKDHYLVALVKYKLWADGPELKEQFIVNFDPSKDQLKISRYAEEGQFGSRYKNPSGVYTGTTTYGYYERTEKYLGFARYEEVGCRVPYQVNFRRNSNNTLTSIYFDSGYDIQYPYPAFNQYRDVFKERFYLWNTFGDHKDFW